MKLQENAPRYRLTPVMQEQKTSSICQRSVYATRRMHRTVTSPVRMTDYSEILVGSVGPSLYCPKTLWSPEQHRNQLNVSCLTRRARTARPSGNRLS